MVLVQHDDARGGLGHRRLPGLLVAHDLSHHGAAVYDAVALLFASSGQTDALLK